MFLIEGLETRRMLSGGGHHVHPFAALHDGKLKVHGTKASDVITVAVDGADPTKLDVTMNGSTLQFDLASVSRLMVVAGKGDDSVSVDSDVHFSCKLIGNAGNDSMTGGSGDDMILGGAGDDSCSGGDGNDVVFGGGGDDHCSGGAGADHFNSGDADSEKLDFNSGEGDSGELLHA